MSIEHPNVEDNELVQEFLNESVEHLAVLESELLGMEKAPEATDAETLNRIFRSVHSIKGTAGFLGFRNIIGLSHVMETLFDRFRKGQMRPTHGLVELLLESSDELKAMVEDLSSEALHDVAPKVAAIERVLAEEVAGEKSEEPSKTRGEKAAERKGGLHHGPWESAPQEFPLRYTLEIEDLDAFERLVEITPVRLFKKLESVGFVAGSEFHSPRIGLRKNKLSKALPLAVYFVSDKSSSELETATGIPEWYFLPDPTQPVIETPEGKTHRIVFCPSAEVCATPGAVDSVFAELKELGECLIDETVVASGGKEYRITLTTSLDEVAVKEVFFFVETGSLVRFVSEFSALEQVLEFGGEKEEISGGSGDIVPVITKAVNGTATGERKAVSGGVSASETLRVPAEKLDRLVNLVGEMVILQAQLMATSKKVVDDFPELQSTVEGMERLGAELRDIVLNIRMMPVGTTFGKYHRLVRDLAKELKKEVELEIEGGDTELDKTVIDQLGDPLVHLLRNSLDHGLETPEEREATGKPRQGKICLTAAHCGDRVVIGISDDGRGLDIEKIRSKAIERGVISAESRLSNAEIQQLIFAPGFSTAQQITGISGRGVGMDVVKKKIEMLGGEVLLDSIAGKGTNLQLSLPLTLAIIEGLMVEVDCGRVIIPLSIVSEIIELTRTERMKHNARNMVDVRGRAVPYVRLRDVFQLSDHAAEIERIVIVEQNGHRLGLVVDKVIGNHQTVLKSLGRLCRNVTHFSGATILGDGAVALVLDVPGIVRSHHASGVSESMLEV